MAPAVIIVAPGANPTLAPVLRQVVLSLAPPAPILTQVQFTGRREIMDHPWPAPATWRLSAGARAAVGATIPSGDRGHQLREACR